MKGFFMQGLTVLFSEAPEVSELKALVDGYDLYDRNGGTDEWPMGGPGFSVGYRPEVNGYASIDICSQVWPDAMGDPQTEPELFGAWSMGFFGPHAFPGGLGRAVQHSYAWPAAEEAVPRHRAFVRLRISYLQGAGPEAKVAPADYDPVAEFSWLVRLARRLLDHPQALCFFNPNGEVLLDATTLDAAMSRADAAGLPQLDAAINVRIWSVDGQWKLADTVGFAQFDQSDHEFAFQPEKHSVGEIVTFPLNLGLYLLQHPGAIQSGHTADGPDGKWRTQERSEPVLSPPRTVMHWTLEDGPRPPASLQRPGPGVALPPDFPSLDEIRQRSVNWLQSPQFAAQYEQMHPSRGLLILASILRPFRGREIMRNAKRRGHPTAQRWQQYQRLPETGDVLFASTVICNIALVDDPNQPVPCLALASFDPAARTTVAQLARRMGALYGSEEPGEDEKALAAIVQDDTYEVWKRTKIPTKFTGGAEVYAFNVLVCLNDFSPDEAEEAPFFIFAERGPAGAAVVIPWKIATADHRLRPPTPPPLPKGPPPLP